MAYSFWGLQVKRLEVRTATESPSEGFWPAGCWCHLDSAQSELSVLGVTCRRRTCRHARAGHARIVPYIDSVFGAFSQPFTLGLTSVNLLACRSWSSCGTSHYCCSPGPRRGRTRSSYGRHRGEPAADHGATVLEALVLAGAAAVVALTIAQFGWKLVFDVATAQAFEPGEVPFWLNSSLSPLTVLYAMVLTLAAAAIADFSRVSK